MKYGVILLNWNGADDTLACLASIRDGEVDAMPIIVDNGSTDDSLLRIRGDFARRNLRLCELESDGTDDRTTLGNTDAVLVSSRKNLGFARGCNLGLRVAMLAGLDVVVYLNNDTTVEPNALTRITRRLRDDHNVAVVLPLMGVHGTEQVWNAGGWISRIGIRRYYFAGAPLARARAAAEIRCTFFTGCCFAVRTAMMIDRGGFTERFFFGEEDFELSLWMKERRLRAVCVTDALIWHKVGASINRASGSHVERRTFVHYLNRLVHMRLRLGRPLWDGWVAAYLPYVVALIWLKGIVAPASLWAFVVDLCRLSRRLDGVDEPCFQAIMSGQREQVVA